MREVMTVATTPFRNVSIAPPIPMKKWTVEEYHQLIERGAFANDNRFELLEGWIVPKMSRNPPHDASRPSHRWTLGAHRRKILVPVM